MTPDQLKGDQALLVAFKGVKNSSKVQIEIAQKVGQVSAIAKMNADDPRFNAGKARRGWMTISAAIAISTWPQFKDEIEQAIVNQESVEVNLPNPVDAEGNEFHLQVREYTLEEYIELYENATSESAKAGYEWVLNNLPKRAKRAGATGGYLLHNGHPIISEVNVDFGIQEHRFLQSDPQRAVTLEGIVPGLSLVDATPATVEVEEAEEVE